MHDFITDVRAILEFLALMAVMAASVLVVIGLCLHVHWSSLGLFVLAPPLWFRAVPYVMPTWMKD